MEQYQSEKGKCNEIKSPQHCFGCNEVLEGYKDENRYNKEIKMKLKCPNCTNIFCVECDIFIHDSLHNCPGCSVE